MDETVLDMALALAPYDSIAEMGLTSLVGPAEDVTGAAVGTGVGSATEEIGVGQNEGSETTGGGFALLLKWLSG